MAVNKKKRNRLAGTGKSASKNKKAYDKAFNQRPDQVKKRVDRNRVRRKALKKGKVKLGDRKDLHSPSRHKKKGSRVVVMDRSKNRGMKNEGGRKKGVSKKSKRK